MKIPQAVQDANIKFAAAGTDHCIAIGDDGTIYGWGEYDNGQYGLNGRMTDICKYKQPEELVEGKIDVDNIAQLTCGNQVTAILMKDGTL